jgi:hypothetical protein
VPRQDLHAIPVHNHDTYLVASKTPTPRPNGASFTTNGNPIRD